MTSMVNCDGFSCFIISLIALDWSITEGIWCDAMMKKSWTSFLKILFMFSYLLCLSGCKVFSPTHVLINMNQKFCPSKVLMTSPRIHCMHIYQSSSWNSGCSIFVDKSEVCTSFQVLMKIQFLRVHLKFWW